jgi:retron-type reverse transcriptase
VWQAWKEIRSELRHATVRDVIDFLDYDIEPDIWIRRLLRQVKAGTYEPHPPLRFSLAKSGGFKRRLTVPAIPDLALFRAIANFVHRKAERHQQPHVYYRRIDLQQAGQAAAQAARQDLQRISEIY